MLTIFSLPGFLVLQEHIPMYYYVVASILAVVLFVVTTVAIVIYKLDIYIHSIIIGCSSKGTPLNFNAMEEEKMERRNACFRACLNVRCGDTGSYLDMDSDSVSCLNQNSSVNLNVEDTDDLSDTDSDSEEHGDEDFPM